MSGAAAAGAAALGGFAPAFWASLSMIIATELGDRTFFLAAIMAMKHDRVAVFVGVMAAMVAMTVISCTFGVAAMVVLPPEYVHYIAAALMLYFSGRMLYEAWKNWNDTGFDEMEEVEQELNKKDDNVDAEAAAGGVAATTTAPAARASAATLSFARIIIQACTVTFVAEWGDRSQLATIALSASYIPVGVVLGGVAGHALCTGFAVIGGKILSKYLSEKHVLASGGVLFFVFAVYTLLTGPPSSAAAAAASAAVSTAS